MTCKICGNKVDILSNHITLVHDGHLQHDIDVCEECYYAILGVIYNRSPINRKVEKDEY